LAELEFRPHGFTLDTDLLQTAVIASFEISFRLKGFKQNAFD
jgi:hypothetical protein